MSRALVLSGGGPVGVAWHAAVTSTLMDAGVDLTAADLIVGTSAGAIIGATIALGRDPRAEIERYRAQASDASPVAQTDDKLAGLVRVMFPGGEPSARERLVSIGKYALEAETPSEEEVLARFGQFAAVEWPPRFVCTAIDASDGRFVVWDADSGVDLALAVTSSCAVPGFFPPVTIDGARYIDGGMRSMNNTDVAKGHDRVLLLSLVNLPASDDPRARRLGAARDSEFAAITEAGGAVELLCPDANIAASLMDFTQTLAAAEAGAVLAARETSRIAAFWS